MKPRFIPLLLAYEAGRRPQPIARRTRESLAVATGGGPRPRFSFLFTLCGLGITAGGSCLAAPPIGLIAIAVEGTTWMAAAGDDPRLHRLLNRHLSCPAGELCRTAADPAEMTNLAGRPEHAGIQENPRAGLDRRLATQGDAGLPPETPAAHAAAKREDHSFPARP